MIREALVFIYVFVFSFYAFINWYRSLCALTLLMAFIRHPDMPRTLLGIQGLTPWNMLLVAVLLGCLVNKNAERLRWDMPGKVTLLLLAYVIVIVIAFIRMYLDSGGIIDYALLRGVTPPTGKDLISEHLINPIKWLIPGMLFFYGCNSMDRFKEGIYSILGVYFLLAVQVVRWMPLRFLHASGYIMQRRAAKLLARNIGYFRVTLAMMLGGGFWAIFLARRLHKSMIARLSLLMASFTSLFALALTGGRAGFLAWIGTGLAVSWFKYRRYFLFIPLVVLILITTVPSFKERLEEGLKPDDSSEEIYVGDVEVNLKKLTSGRVLAWPLVIEKIKESPFFGYGLRAMERLGIATYIWTELHEIFGHPHNAYLRCLLNNGLIGCVLVLALYLLMLKYSISLFRDTRSLIFETAGGVAFTIMMAFFIACMGGQTFFPREDSVPMWAAIGIMLRLYVQRQKLEGKEGPILDEALWG